MKKEKEKLKTFSVQPPNPKPKNPHLFFDEICLGMQVPHETLILSSYATNQQSQLLYLKFCSVHFYKRYDREFKLRFVKYCQVKSSHFKSSQIKSIKSTIIFLITNPSEHCSLPRYNISWHILASRYATLVGIGATPVSLIPYYSCATIK